VRAIAVLFAFAAACGRIGFDPIGDAGGPGTTASTPRLWLLGGSDGSGVTATVFASSDGVTWQDAGAQLPAASYDAAVLRFHDAIYYIGGGDSVLTRTTVLRSADGIQWSQVGDLPVGGVSVISYVYDDQMWIVGGETTDNTPSTIRTSVWRSSDGVTWQNANGSPGTANGSLPFGRDLTVGLVFAGRMWLIGGKDITATFRTNVWQSIDGVLWLNADDSAASEDGAFPIPLWGGDNGTVFQDRMWVVGDDDGTAIRSDVYSSADGQVWTPATGHDNPPRSGASIVAYRGQLWMIGGAPSYAIHADPGVFRSADGVTWTHVGDLPAPRALANTVVAFEPGMPDTRLAFTGGTTNLTNGACSPAFTVQSEDDAGNATQVAQPATAYLYEFAPATGVIDGLLHFFSDAGCTTAIDRVALDPNLPAPQLYMRATASGSHRVIAWAADRDIASTTIVTP
jgi:hypothetical protein